MLDQVKKEDVIFVGDRTYMDKKHLFVLWKISSLCNYNCSYCGEKGTDKIQDINFYYDIIDKFVGLGKEYIHVCITGGEPTLFPQIKSLFKYIVEQFKWVSQKQIKLVTNFSFPPDLYIDLIESSQNTSTMILAISLHPHVDIDISKIEQNIYKLIHYPNINIDIRIPTYPRLFNRAKHIYGELEYMNKNSKISVYPKRVFGEEELDGKEMVWCKQKNIEVLEQQIHLQKKTTILFPFIYKQGSQICQTLINREMLCWYNLIDYSDWLCFTKGSNLFIDEAGKPYCCFNTNKFNYLEISPKEFENILCMRCPKNTPCTCGLHLPKFNLKQYTHLRHEFIR